MSPVRSSSFRERRLAKYCGKGEELMRREWQGLPTAMLEGGPVQLTRQKTWAQSPCFSRLSPQMFGSASARRHSRHAAGDRANGTGHEHLCGALSPQHRPQGLLWPCLPG